MGQVMARAMWVPAALLLAWKSHHRGWTDDLRRVANAQISLTGSSVGVSGIGHQPDTLRMQFGLSGSFFGSTNVSSYISGHQCRSSIFLSIPTNALSPYNGTTVEVYVAVSMPLLASKGCQIVDSNNYPVQIGASTSPPTITGVAPQPVNISGTAAQVTITGTGLASSCMVSDGLPPPTIIFGNTNQFRRT